MQLDDVDVEIVNWRVTVTGPATGRSSRPALPAERGKPKAKRTAWMNGGPEPVDVYDRAALAAGQEVAGPAIIEERETTIVLLAGWRATVDRTGCIVATKG